MQVSELMLRDATLIAEEDSVQAAAPCQVRCSVSAQGSADPGTAQSRYRAAPSGGDVARLGAACRS